MKYEVILENEQGAVFSEKFNTKKECQGYLDTFYDPENLTGKVVDNENGAKVATKKISRFSWS